jgi:ABC-type nitrate/sulfonate/bicarbonate transport system permease component
MTSRQMRNISKSFGLVLLVVLGLELLLNTLRVPGYILPRPSEIVISVYDAPHALLVAWATTFFEAMAGLVLAVTISTMLAALTIFLPSSVARAINSLGIAIQSTPLLAIAPLLSLWLGQTFAAKMAAACIICFFPLLTGWLSGLRSVSQEYQQLFESMDANAWQKARYLLAPSALPYFFSGLRVAAPLSLLGAIVGEFVGSSEGIGFQILSASYYLRTAQMFAYVLVAALTGWLLSQLIIYFEKRLLFWYGQNRT